MVTTSPTAESPRSGLTVPWRPGPRRLSPGPADRWVAGTPQCTTARHGGSDEQEDDCPEHRRPDQLRRGPCGTLGCPEGGGRIGLGRTGPR
ncbi:hypothetical protein ACFFX0_17285 [Citricoccus parietis]|uniref:Uncharacterized protein n=1 Tax=Citricoccus parietis TaxID=592307 RepID=A0ABV5G2H0_9MICC